VLVSTPIRFPINPFCHARGMNDPWLQSWPIMKRRGYATDATSESSSVIA
jgi:hypothetical protein